MNGAIIPSEVDELVEYSSAFILSRKGKLITLNFNGETLTSGSIGYTLPVRYRPRKFTVYNIVLVTSGNTSKLGYLVVEYGTGTLGVYIVNSDGSITSNYSGRVFGSLTYTTE